MIWGSGKSLLELPEDLILEIVGFLDIASILSLLSTCRAAHIYDASHALWFVGATSISRLRPLPCPPGVDISTLDRATLKKYAQHASRLYANWRRPCPRATGPPVLARCGPGHVILAVVPGTRFILLHHVQNALVSCWNGATGRSHATESLEGDVFAMSQRYAALPGTCTMVCGARDATSTQMSITVLRVDYGGEEVRLTKLWTELLGEQQIGVLDIVVYEDVVGVIYAVRGQSAGKLRVANMISGYRTELMLDFGLALHDFYAAIIDRTLYISVAEDTNRQLWRLPPSALPYGTTLPYPHACLEPVALPFTSVRADSDNLFGGTFSAVSLSDSTGACVAVRTTELIQHTPDVTTGAEEGNGQFLVHASYCTAPLSIADFGHATAQARSRLPPAQHSVALPGLLRMHEEIGVPLVSLSVDYMLMCIGTTAGSYHDWVLRLVHPPIPGDDGGADGEGGGEPRVVALALPSTVHPEKIAEIRLDAWLGHVYFLDDLGYLHCVPYA